MPLTETEIIQKYFRPLTMSNPAAHGLSDDTAAFALAEDELCITTTDMLVAGVHFYPDDNPQDIAWKALAVNISDIVASAGQPEYYLLSLGLAEGTDENWIAGFVQGLAEAQKAFGAVLIGGDTTQTPGPHTISITAIGRAPKEARTTRNGARPGDIVYVTGTIGDAWLGCQLRAGDALKEGCGITDGDAAHLIKRYLRPEPRIDCVGIMREFVSSGMDISDGLMLDFTRLMSASGFGGEIQIGNVPLSPSAKRLVHAHPELQRDLVSGGDDYELLMTVPADVNDKFLSRTQELATDFTAIGTCVADPQRINCFDKSGQPVAFEHAGYDHFQKI